MKVSAPLPEPPEVNKIIGDPPVPNLGTIVMGSWVPDEIVMENPVDIV